MNAPLNHLFEYRRISSSSLFWQTDLAKTHLPWQVILGMVEHTFEDVKIISSAMNHCGYTKDGERIVLFAVRVGRNQTITMYYNGKIFGNNVSLDFLFNNTKLITIMLDLFERE